jgi:hypothetical protein
MGGLFQENLKRNPGVKCKFIDDKPGPLTNVDNRNFAVHMKLQNIASIALRSNMLDLADMRPMLKHDRRPAG